MFERMQSYFLSDIHRIYRLHRFSDFSTYASITFLGAMLVANVLRDTTQRIVGAEYALMLVIALAVVGSSLSIVGSVCRIFASRLLRKQSLEMHAQGLRI